MNILNPIGKTVVNGTYAGALMPVFVSAERLKMALEPDFYDQIGAIGGKLYQGVNELFKKYREKDTVATLAHGLAYTLESIMKKMILISVR